MRWIRSEGRATWADRASEAAEERHEEYALERGDPPYGPPHDAPWAAARRRASARAAIRGPAAAGPTRPRTMRMQTEPRAGGRVRGGARGPACSATSRGLPSSHHAHRGARRPRGLGGETGSINTCSLRPRPHGHTMVTTPRHRSTWKTSRLVNRSAGASQPRRRGRCPTKRGSGAMRLRLWQGRGARPPCRCKPGLAGDPHPPPQGNLVVARPVLPHGPKSAM